MIELNGHVNNVKKNFFAFITHAIRKLQKKKNRGKEEIDVVIITGEKQEIRNSIV